MFLGDSAFLYVGCMYGRLPVGVTYLSRTKSELAGPHRLMSSSDPCIDIRIHVSICGGMERFIIRLMYV